MEPHGVTLTPLGPLPQLDAPTHVTWQLHARVRLMCMKPYRGFEPCMMPIHGGPDRPVTLAGVWVFRGVTPSVEYVRSRQQACASAPACLYLIIDLDGTGPCPAKPDP